MKFYLRTYRIPMVLIIMGALMSIAASLRFAENYVSELFWFGILCIALGVLGWLSVQAMKILRRRTAKSKKTSSKRTGRGRFGV